MRGAVECVQFECVVGESVLSYERPCRGEGSMSTRAADRTVYEVGRRQAMEYIPSHLRQQQQPPMTQPRSPPPKRLPVFDPCHGNTYRCLAPCKHVQIISLEALAPARRFQYSQGAEEGFQVISLSLPLSPQPAVCHAGPSGMVSASTNYDVLHPDRHLRATSMLREATEAVQVRQSRQRVDCENDTS